jgi:hypothetical protein
MTVEGLVLCLAKVTEVPTYLLILRIEKKALKDNVQE